MVGERDCNYESRKSAARPEVGPNPGLRRKIEAGAESLMAIPAEAF